MPPSPRHKPSGGSQQQEGEGGMMCSVGADPGQGAGPYFYRLGVLQAKYGKNGMSIPDALSEDIMTYTPRVLHNLLEVERQRCAAQQQQQQQQHWSQYSELDSIETAIGNTSVWNSACSLQSTLMLADVSGFCKVSEELCAQGAEGLDKLRTAINECFNSLIEEIAQYGGDILNFAGDALIIMWSPLTPSHEVRRRLLQSMGGGSIRPDASSMPRDASSMPHDSSSMPRASRLRISAANKAASAAPIAEICPFMLQALLSPQGLESLPQGARDELELRNRLQAAAAVMCGLSLAARTPKFDTKLLKLHVGIVSGPLECFVVGGDSMGFQFITMSPIYTELGEAVTAAASTQCVVGKSTRALTEAAFEAAPVEGAPGLFLVGAANHEQLKLAMDQLERYMQSNDAVRILSSGALTNTPTAGVSPTPTAGVGAAGAGTGAGEAGAAAGGVSTSRAGATTTTTTTATAGAPSSPVVSSPLGSPAALPQLSEGLEAPHSGQLTPRGEPRHPTIVLLPGAPQRRTLQQEQQEQTWRTIKALAFLPPAPELDTDSPTPNMSVESQIREATVVFVNLSGPRIVAALNSTGNSSSSGTLAFMQQVMSCAQQSTHLHEAMMRQFLVDDKGMVMIFALGVPHCQHMDDPLRGLRTAHHFCKGLAKIGVIAYAGVTTGRAYVGTVGNRQRKEYALVGDSINLSARLMAYGLHHNFQGYSKAYCWPKEPAKFCIVTEERTMSCGREYFKFELHPSIKIKGKASMDAYELINVMTSDAPSAAQTLCVGFDREKSYVMSLLRLKEYRRRVSYVKTATLANIRFADKSGGATSKTGSATSKSVSAASKTVSAASRSVCASDSNTKMPTFNNNRLTDRAGTASKSGSATNTNFIMQPPLEPEPRRVSLAFMPYDLSSEVDFVELTATKNGNGKWKGTQQQLHQQHQQHQEHQEHQEHQHPRSGQHEAARQDEGHGQRQEEQRDAPASPGSPHEEQEMANSDLLNASTAAAIARVDNDSDDDEEEGHGAASSDSVASSEDLALLQERARCGKIGVRRDVFAGKLSHRGGVILVLRGDEGGGKSTFHKLVTQKAGMCGVVCASVKLKQTDPFQPYSALAQIFQTLFEREDIRHFSANPEKTVFEQTMLEWNRMLTPKEQAMLPEVKRTVLKMGSWNIAGWKPSNEHRSGSKGESHEMIQEILLKLLMTPTVSKLFNEAVVLVVDNINFMDSCSWEVLVQVIVVPTTHLLVICTAPAQKPPGKMHWPKAQEGGEAGAEAGDAAAHRKLKVFVQRLSASAGEIQSLVLGRLSRNETEEAVRQAFPSQAFSTEDCGAIWKESQGHPYRAIETARALVLTPNAHAGSAGEEAVGAAAGDNDPITKAITARIDSLRIDEQRCLKAASVIGVEFKYETLLEIVPRQYLRLREDKMTLLDMVLQDLIKQEFIRCVSETTIKGRRDATFEFTHTRMRTTCYNLLLRADQVKYHKQVANWIATRYQDDLRKFYVPLMFHLFKANDFDKGVDYAIGSIKQSIVSGAFGECKVIIEEVLHFIESKKINPRTIRMVYNTLAHLLRQHQDPPLMGGQEEEKMADVSDSTGDPSYIKSPADNEDEGFRDARAGNRDSRAGKFKYVPSTRILLTDAVEETRSEGNSSESVHSVNVSSESSETDKDSKTVSTRMFRTDVTNNSRAKSTFWEYLEGVVLRIGRALNPAPAEGNEDLRSSADSHVKSSAAGKNLPPAKSSHVCAVM
jgi:class 3 adenylate cyclase